MITVDFFFICDYVLYSLEQGEVNVLWLVLFVALPTTGYFGILNNSVGLRDGIESKSGLASPIFFCHILILIFSEIFLKIH